MSKKMKNLGSVTQIYSSGMVETDKGFKYPGANAKLGDVMLEDDGNRHFLSKEEYKERYGKTAPKRRTSKAKKEVISKTKEEVGEPSSLNETKDKEEQDGSANE